jgi:hypothetical protein
MRETTRGWRKLHVEELDDLHSSSNTFLNVQSLDTGTCDRRNGKCTSNFNNESEQKMPFRRYGHR